MDPVKEFVASQAGKSESAKKQARIVSSGFVRFSKKEDPSKWSKEDVFGYISKIEEDHTRNTLYNYSVYLRSFLRFQGRDDLAELMKPPRRPEILKVVPSDGEVTRMMAGAENPRDRLIVQIISRTGLRVGELCHIDVSDIDLENRQFRIVAWGHWAPKGLKERRVPFDTETAEQIKSYLKDLEIERLFDISESYVRRIVKNLAEKAQIKDARKVTPHSLRHSFAVHFLQHGGDVRSLQKILGHADLSTTAIYLSYTEEAVARAYDKVFEKTTVEGG